MSDDLDWTVRSPSLPADDSRLALVAHSLLGSVTAVRGAIELATNSGPVVTQRDSLLALALRRLEVMAEELRGLAGGLPTDALTFLDDLHDSPSTEDLREGTCIEVHSSFTDTWVPGFEIAETVIGGYRIRRASDGSVLSGFVAPKDLRVARERRFALPASTR